ncbi:MAG: hypothetical protein Alpg2KO_13080 [Alphaproteobacteria bacterium]
MKFKGTSIDTNPSPLDRDAGKDDDEDSRMISSLGAAKRRAEEKLKAAGQERSEPVLKSGDRNSRQAQKVDRLMRNELKNNPEVLETVQSMVTSES